MLCPWTMKMIFYFLLLFKKIMQRLVGHSLFGAMITTWTNQTCTIRGRQFPFVITLCTIAGIALACQCFSCRVWVDSAVQKAMRNISRLKLFDTESQIHTFTEWLMLGGISGDQLVWLLCLEHGHRRLSRTVSTWVLGTSKDGVSIAFLGNKSGHWILLRRAWLHLLYLPSRW